MRHYREAQFLVVHVSPSSLVVLREKYIARAAPSAFGSSPRQGSQDAGCDSAGVMFHVKHDSDERSTSVLSPPSGENQRGGGSSGILRYEHIQRIWCYPLLTVKWIVFCVYR